MWSDLKIRFASLFRRTAMEREMAEELRAHVEHETEKLVRAGLPRDEAHRRASAAFGGIELMKEPSRDARGTRWVEEAWHDVRHGVLLLGKQKRFTAALVLTMALGIGANTAITGAIDEILWRPLTVPHADRIIGVFGFDRLSSSFLPLSLPDVRDLGRASSLDVFAGYYRRPMRVTSETRSGTLTGEVVTPGYFRVLAAPFVIGRPFSSEDETSSAPVAVISERLWRESFGAAANVVGQTIQIEAHNVPIVGVASRQLRGDHNLTWYTAPDVWIPAAATPALFGKRLEGILRNRAAPLFSPLGLLRPNVSAGAAEAELNAIFASVSSNNRPGIGSLKVFRAAEAKIYPGRRAGAARNLSAFGIAAILILLLAAANVANLLVERTTRRRREMAVRAALGAGRGRIIRQLFVEGLVLAAPGFVLSVLVAAGLQRVLTAFPSALGVASLSIDLEITGRVLAYCGVVSVLIAAAVSVIPAMRTAREGPGPLLKHAAVGTIRRGRSWVSQSLTVFQVGLAAVLLVGSLVMVRGLWSAHTLPLGFDLSQTIVLSVDRPPTASGARAPRPTTVLDRGAWLPPVVTHVALASYPPFTGGSSVTTVQDAAARGTSVSTDMYFVSGSFFETLRIPILSGRGFDSHDTAAAQPVIVNDALARRLWGAQSALGRTLMIGNTSFDVIGVAADTRYRDVWDSARMQLYHPIGSDAEEGRTVLVRADGSPAALLPSITRAWNRLAPNVPIADAITGEGFKSRALEPMRLTGALIGVFTLVAIGIAAVGLYSTTAWLVDQRSREIAVRIAVGGRPGHIGGRVMVRALALTIVGSAIGYAIAVTLVPRLSGLTHGMASQDSWVTMTSAVVLVGVSFCAAAVPTLRAVRIDPMVILKSE